MKKLLSVWLIVIYTSLFGYTVQAEELSTGTDGATMKSETPKMQMPKLTDEQKAQLEVLKKEHKAAMDELFAAMKEATTDEEKEAIREKIKTLNEEHMAAIKEIAPELGNMPKMGGKEWKKNNEMKPPMGKEGTSWEMMNMPELTDDQKEQIKEIMDSFKEEMEAIHKAMKSATSEEDRKYIAEKMKALRDAQIEKIAAISPEMAEHMKKMEKKMKGEMGKKWNMPKMEGEEWTEDEAMWERNPPKKWWESDMKWRYKEAFAEKLGSKLDSMSKEKLQKVLTKIEAAEEKISSNSMSETKKEKLLAQLGALKELIEEQLNPEEDEIDLEELFAE